MYYFIYVCVEHSWMGTVYKLYTEAVLQHSATASDRNNVILTSESVVNVLISRLPFFPLTSKLTVVSTTDLVCKYRVYWSDHHL